MSQDYKSTLNLPKTDFPMRANLPEREPEFLAFWEKIGLYERLLDRKGKAPQYVLHDGPPYANGDIHVGTAFNKVLKDLVCRIHWMKGEYAPFIPGWDCHGQPIEQQVEKQLGEKKNRITQAEFRELCRDYANTYINRQREQFKRLGVLGIWERPYLTLDPDYEATNVEIFHRLYKRGLVYRGKKPIYWCYTDRTALAEAEIEYHEHESPSIKVKFRLKDGLEGVDVPVYAVIWTTTPWTLPANVAVAFHPDEIYGVYSNGSEALVLAEKLAGHTVDEFYTQVLRVEGKTFEGKKFVHPIFSDRESVGVLADFVDMSTGTGIVHIAPGHGEEDYYLGLEYDLPIVMPVDEDGRFTEEVPPFAGMHVEEANSAIIEYLSSNGLLISSDKVTHSYPHCWRCKNPVIFRATEQWFIAVKDNGLKKEALEAISQVKWIPEWSVNRIRSMVEQRPDWCISRQRSWGVPIPIIYCSQCGAVQDDDSVFEKVKNVFAREGADSWFKNDASYFVPEGHRCSCGSTDFVKEMDIFDVWFESGISHFAVLRKRDEVSWPADMYLEGSDQHRGWFQSSLLTSVGAESKPPYRAVLTHGFTVDEQGRKMSKSLGNVVDPLEVIKEMGADVLRLWAVASDYTADVAISSQILERISDIYRRIRNTFRFMLGNLYDFDPEKDALSLADLDDIDRFILMKLKKLSDRVLNSYENYTFHHVVHDVHNFCAVDLSSFYLDVLKDRLYAEKADGQLRRSTQTALFIILRTLVKLIAPVLPFTAEDVWQKIPGEKEESVHLTTFEDLSSVEMSDELYSEWEALLEIRDDYLRFYEKAKESGVVKTMMEAEIDYAPYEKYRKVVEENRQNLYYVFMSRNVNIVDDVEGEAGNTGVFKVRKTGGSKCLRCWNWTYDVKDNICSRCRQVLEGGN